MNSWRKSTRTTYKTYLSKWALYCVDKNISVLKPKLNQATTFLRKLFEEGQGYSAVNTARSALSLILPRFGDFSFGTHPVVCQLVKAVYNMKPPKSRYTQFWDVKHVLRLFKDWGQNNELSLKDLSRKLVMLLLLTTAQRGQTIVSLTLRGLQLENRQAIFHLESLLKHNRVGDPLDTLKIKAFPECRRLCVLAALKNYLQRTEQLRESTTEGSLFISFRKPYLPISRDTLARWTVSVLADAGIDTVRYGSHSTRGASTSAARVMGVPINTILKQASWKSASSFGRFYNRELEHDVDALAHGVLHQVAVE